MGTKCSIDFFHGNLIQTQLTFCLFHLRYRIRLTEIHATLLAYQARALRALGLLLADGTPTVGGGKTF